jgi:hypothetical protein
MSFSRRLMGGSLIFLVGSQVIYYGMRLNGSDRIQGPVWAFVSSLHSLMVFGFVILGLWALTRVLLPLLASIIFGENSKNSSQVGGSPRPPDSAQLDQRVDKQCNFQGVSREKHKIFEQERTLEQRRLEEQKKKEVTRARGERSADAAAQAGLGDFL